MTYALRQAFPRYATSCDRCDCEVGYGTYTTSEIDTAAGSFKYTLCHGCSDALRRSRKDARERARNRAIVRRASRYSKEFGTFVAQWFGVSPKAVRA